MNSNFIHNIINIIGLIVGALITVDWTGLGLDPTTAAKVAGGVLLLSNLIKVTMNLTRDGASGLTKPQPPVDQAAKPLAAAPASSAAPS